jgi:Family of unknown function (DUF5670)
VATTIAVLLVVMWLMGVISAHTMGGFIHLLLLLAVVAVVVRLTQGRAPL